MTTIAGSRAVTAGRIVRYMSPKGYRPALVVATADDLIEESIESGATELINKDGGVHLVWFDHETRPAHGGVIGDPNTVNAWNIGYAQDDGEGIPIGTWTWPEQV